MAAFFFTQPIMDIANAIKADASNASSMYFTLFFARSEERVLFDIVIAAIVW